MAATLSREEFLRNLSDSGLFSSEEMSSSLQALPEISSPDGEGMAQGLIAAGKLTVFQATAIRERQFDELVIGNYQVLDRLGAGGMGTVYKARHRRMKRVVALKVLGRGGIQSPMLVKRFQREVEAVARLNHPNIVMAHDADEAQVGPFLVMEFVDGCDLATTVQQRGPRPVPEAVECILQAARALNYAHAQGITHRDIKPANLLRDANGVVKVADLGLARFNDALGQSGEETGGALTQANTILGTVDYMAPEQTLGLPTVDRRADVYSLGCTLFYLLTGRPPYQGQTLMGTLLQHREGPIPSLAAERNDVPSALDQVFQRMVAKKPEDRFDSMDEVVRALEAVAQGPAPAAPVASEGRAADTRGMTALLVEPSRSQAVIIRGYLQKLGFRDCPTAPSGAKALELARNAPPDVVISAMHLPDMTGVQLARSMRNQPRSSSAGFILITSEMNDEEAAQVLGEGGNTVRLPKPFDLDRLARAIAATSSGPQPQPGSSLPSRAGRLRALVVDDSAAARAHVRSVLTALGLRHIVEAADGVEAIALLEKESYDLVVTDYMMPRLGGRELIAFIRQRSSTPSVPVIMVTTETDQGRLDAVRQLGVSAICDKRFEREVVRGVLETLG